MQLVIGRDGKTEKGMADALDPAHEPRVDGAQRKVEGRTETLANPPPHELAWAPWLVARLGGW